MGGGGGEGIIQVEAVVNSDQTKLPLHYNTQSEVHCYQIKNKYYASLAKTQNYFTKVNFYSN